MPEMVEIGPRRSDSVEQEVSNLLAQLGSASRREKSRKRTLSFGNLADSIDVAYMPLRDENEVGAASVPWDAAVGASEEVKLRRVVPFVAPGGVMKARVVYRESGTMFSVDAAAPDAYFVRGDAYEPRLRGGARYAHFDPRRGTVARGAALERGSHAFLRLRGESYLRVATACRAFGGCAADYANLAHAPKAEHVLLRGEIETGGDGVLLRWISRGGTLRLRRRTDLDLPPSLMWDYVDTVYGDAAETATRPHSSKVQRLAGEGFAVKNSDPSPACVSRTIDI